MQSFPADMQRKVALELTPSELFKMCSDDTFKRTICDSKEFWLLKLEKDYPDMFRYYKKHSMKFANPKNTYVKKFSKYSEAVEHFVQKFYPVEQRQEKYNLIYQLFRELVALPVVYTGKSPILNYTTLLISPRTDKSGMSGELERLLFPFVKEEHKYKY